MARYTLLPAALDHLDDIFDYTLRTWGEQQAEAYVREGARVAIGGGFPPLIFSTLTLEALSLSLSDAASAVSTMDDPVKPLCS